MDAGDAMLPAEPTAPAPATESAVDAPAALSDASDDRAKRAAALRDLAAMIGVEVFY